MMITLANFNRSDYCNSMFCLLHRRRSWTNCSMFKMLQHV